eukprot:304401_1
MSSFLNTIQQSINNSTQRNEFKLQFLRDCTSKNSNDISNCIYNISFKGNLLINFKQKRNPQIIHQYWEIEDHRATSIQTNNPNQEMEIDHKIDNENIIIMSESDRILYEDGYRLQPYRSLIEIELELNKDDKQYHQTSIRKIMNGWFRYITDIDLGDSKCQFFIFTGIHPVANGAIYTPVIVIPDAKTNTIANRLNTITRALDKIGSWVSVTDDNDAKKRWFGQYIGPSIERPKATSVCSVSKFGGVLSTQLKHSVLIDPFGTIWSPSLKRHCTMLEAGIMVTPTTLNKLGITNEKIHTLPRIPTSDEIKNVPKTIDGEIGREALGDNNFIIAMTGPAAILLSIDKNLDFVRDKAGGTPSILIEGPPSTGKSTQTQMKCQIYGTDMSSSVCVLYKWSSSALTSTRDSLPHISLSIDDVDYDKAYQATNKQSFWMTAHSTGVDITQANGLREGSSALTTAICNDSDICVDWNNRAVFGRIELLIWRDHLATISVQKRAETLTQWKTFLHSFKHQSHKFLVNIDFTQYPIYLQEVIQIYLQFTTKELLLKHLPFRSVEFKAILLLALDYISTNIVLWSKKITRTVLRQLWEESYQKVPEVAPTAKCNPSIKDKTQKELDFELKVKQLLSYFIPYITRTIQNNLKEKDLKIYEDWKSKNLMNVKKIDSVKCYIIESNIFDSMLQMVKRYNSDIFEKFNGSKLKIFQCVKKMGWLYTNTTNRNTAKFSSKYFYCIKKELVDEFCDQQKRSVESIEDEDDD